MYYKSTIPCTREALQLRLRYTPNNNIFYHLRVALFIILQCIAARYTFVAENIVENHIFSQ